MKKIALLCLFVGCVFTSVAENVRSITSVAVRVAPWLKGKVKAVEIPADNGNDVYEFYTEDDRLVIKANCMPAAGMALNHYLKHYCKRHFSLTGTNLAPVYELPVVERPVRKVSPFKYRHALNFCTQNYSGAFWTWTEWERMIDFMVLNGVNLTLATTGLEQVWYNTLRQFNFSHKEIMDFLPGPAFNAWHMMANLEGWGGPITRETIAMRAKLQKKIVKRLREYGINPIYMSFYGMVPALLQEKYPDAVIKEQGRWVGGFRRPSLLLPGQELYDRMADTYYREVRKLYGPFHYFAGEPFHEGGDRTGIDIGDLARRVLVKMRQYNPGCVWVLQGWGGNPSSAFLSKLSKENDVLIWDMRGELGAEWERRKGYDGYPYLWGVINNFGETTGLYGRLARFGRELFRAKNSPYGSNLQGLSVAPEGILNNPVNYDLLYELAWNREPVDVDEWIIRYSEYRYGRPDRSMEQVWKILLQTAYSSEADPMSAEPGSNTLPTIVGNAESLVCAPPSLNLRRTSSWGTSVLFYDYRKMRTIAPLLLQAIDRLQGVDAFEYDLVDFTRQLLSNEFKAHYAQANAAIARSDAKQMEVHAAQMMELMADMDALLSTRPEFMVGTWLGSAKRMGKTAYEKALYEKNARTIITYWGTDVPNTDLRDYAHKEWSGLIKDVYMPRWKNFFDYQAKRLRGEPCTASHPVELELDWAEKNNPYPDTPQASPVEISRKLLEKYMRGF